MGCQGEEGDGGGEGRRAGSGRVSDCVEAGWERDGGGTDGEEEGEEGSVLFIVVQFVRFGGPCCAGHGWQ